MIGRDNKYLKSNILENLPSSIAAETLETIVQTDKLKIERIISKGHQSTDGFWYDQDQAEWVMLVKGQARIQFENEVIELHAGDYLNIDAHRKHRIEWTTPEEESIWLAVFYSTKPHDEI